MKIVIWLLLSLSWTSNAQRTRFIFGRFSLRFGDENHLVLECDGDGGGPWDATAEAIRSGAEECLRTVHCDDFSITPFFVGLGNVQCQSETVTFVGGGAMDFSDVDVPLDPVIVEDCVRTVLQSPACVPIFATHYDKRITSPPTFTSRRYPALTVPSDEEKSTNFSGGTHGTEVLAQTKEEEAENMPISFYGIIAGACTSAFVIGCLALFLLNRRRRSHNPTTTAKNKEILSKTALDITNDDSVEDDMECGLSKADSLGTRNSTRQTGLGRMLENQPTNTTEDDGQHTPTTTKEADASFESAYEYYDGEVVEVGLDESPFFGPYDARPVKEAALLDDVMGLPMIVVPANATPFEEPNPFHTQLQSFQLAPFIEKSYDEGSSTVSALKQTYGVDDQMESKFRTMDDMPHLEQTSDDYSSGGQSSDDSLLKDLQSENDEVVELLSDGCASTTLMDSDHEFEPDAYWDPDDNSISTMDAAGLVAMGTGEFSFQPTKTNTTEKEQSPSSPVETPQEPPRSLYKWLCDAPTLCTSSNSLPSLLGGTKRPATVQQRTKSYTDAGSAPQGK